MSKRSTTTRDRDRAAIRRTKPPCGICEGEIDYSLKWPDPWCFVVDHIVPIDSGKTPEEQAALDVLSNKQAAHHKCNRDKWNKVERSVLLICGPPGAGKTTLAHQLGVTVYDLDDPHWNGSEQLFRQALEQLARNSQAQAAVIRSGSTLSARQSAASLCGATAVTVVETDLETCIERIRTRGRLKQSIKVQIASAQDWWSKYEPGPITLTQSGGEKPVRTFITARSW